MEIKINNIIVKTNGSGFKFEALIPNAYFGKEEELLEEGYKKFTSTIKGKERWSLCKNNHSIDQSCFQNEKQKIGIAYLSYHESEEDYNLHTVGSRIVDLSDKDLKDFMESYKLIMKYVRDRDK